MNSIHLVVAAEKHPDRKEQIGAREDVETALRYGKEYLKLVVLEPEDEPVDGTADVK